MNKLKLALIFFLLFLISSCGNITLERGSSISSTAAAVDSIKADKDNVGKRYSITGFLYYSPPPTIYINRPQTVNVYKDKDHSTLIADLDMPWGENQSNHVFLNEADGTIIFYDNEKHPVSINEPVDVSFETSEAELYLQNIRIDKVISCAEPPSPKK